MKKPKDNLDLLNPADPEVRKILLNDLFWDQDAYRNIENRRPVARVGQAVRLGVYKKNPKNIAAIARTTRIDERSVGRHLETLEGQKRVARHPDNPKLWILGENSEFETVTEHYDLLLQGRIRTSRELSRYADKLSGKMPT